MTVHIYDDIQKMTGIGEEWLIRSDGTVIVVFIDGNLRQDGIIGGNREVTI